MGSYHQYCGLARTLDVVGDRWSLLIVRELLIGPARTRDLAAALPGIASNLLSDRLRHLVACGVVDRQQEPGAKAVRYQLTELGEGLRTPVQELLRWSIPLMATGPRPDDHFRPHWLVLALESFLGPRTWSTTSQVEVHVDDATVRIVLSDHGAHTTVTPTADAGADAESPTDEPAPAADLVVATPAPVLLGWCSGALGLDDVERLVTVRSGRVSDLALLAP
jgi:DNA-binding HxlR family transcriptional regulator